MTRILLALPAVLLAVGGAMHLAAFRRPRRPSPHRIFLSSSATR
jgi:hypothetical protein